MSRLVAIVAVSCLVISGCAQRTYLTRAEFVSGQPIEVVPAIRERDGAPAALARGTFARVVDDARPTPAGMVRVSGRGHRHPLARAGMVTFIAGVVVSLTGMVLTLTGVCIGGRGCTGTAAQYYSGIAISALGDAAFLIAGPIMWGIGAHREPRELRYEPTARATSVVDLRF